MEFLSLALANPIYSSSSFAKMLKQGPETQNKHNIKMFQIFAWVLC